MSNEDESQSCQIKYETYFLTAEIGPELTLDYPLNNPSASS